MNDKQAAAEEALRMWPESDPAFFLNLSIDAERSFLIQRQAFEMGARWQREQEGKR